MDPATHVENVATNFLTSKQVERVESADVDFSTMQPSILEQYFGSNITARTKRARTARTASLLHALPSFRKWRIILLSFRLTLLRQTQRSAGGLSFLRVLPSHHNLLRSFVLLLLKALLSALGPKANQRAKRVRRHHRRQFLIYMSGRAIFGTLPTQHIVEN